MGDGCIMKRFNYRIYPNAKQQEQIQATFDGCLVVYNTGWEVMEEDYGEGGLRSTNDYVRMISGWKRGDDPRLSEEDVKALDSAECAPLQQAMRDARLAWKRYLGHKTEKPKKKDGRASRRSYRTPHCNGNRPGVLDEKHVIMPKLGVVRAKVSRELEGKVKSATVVRERSGEYFVSFLCEVTEGTAVRIEASGVLGIDAGCHDTITRSDGAKFENPHALKRHKKRLDREKQKLRRKKKGSANYEKQRVKVAKLNARIARTRRDSMSKATTQTVRDAIKNGQAIAVENLGVRGMMNDRGMAKTIADAAMAEMLRQVEYKCRWNGVPLVKVGRNFASTQICSSCGKVTGPTGPSQLNVREWTCAKCGAKHDRDVNAAINIANEASQHRQRSEV